MARGGSQAGGLQLYRRDSGRCKGNWGGGQFFCTGFNSMPKYLKGGGVGRKVKADVN